MPAASDGCSAIDGGRCVAASAGDTDMRSKPVRDGTEKMVGICCIGLSLPLPPPPLRMEVEAEAEAALESALRGNTKGSLMTGGLRDLRPNTRNTATYNKMSS